MKKYMAATIKYLILIMCLCVLTGCGDKTDGAETVDNGPMLYYLDKNSYELVPVKCASTSTDVTRAASDMLETLAYSTYDNSVVAPLAGPIGVTEVTFDGGMLTVDLNRTYSYIEPSREILVRAAIVKSLTSIYGVNSVYILVDSAPLKGAGGEEVGVMTAESFVDETGINYNENN